MYYSVLVRNSLSVRLQVRCDFALAEDPAVAGQLFLQQAETVRLACPGALSGAMPVTEAGKASDALPTIRVRATTKGTHVGRAIGARVTER